jgi:hypothetical protein
MSISPFNTNFEQTFNPNIKSPYIANVTTRMPQPMAGAVTEDDLYPLESSLSTPQLNNTSTPEYARGGRVKKGSSKKNNPYPALAEMIRQQGKGHDTILAHINPLEAMMLKQMGGSGTINPVTGLPQFGFFNRPGKWLKSVAGPVVGIIGGNMLFPGLGGIIGGGLGGVAGSKIRGRKDFGQSALRGAAMGMLAPTVSSLAGSAANAVGLKGAGAALTNYGSRNAIFPALGKLVSGSGSPAPAASASGTIPSASKIAANKFATPVVTLPSPANTGLPLGMMPSAGMPPMQMAAIQEAAPTSFLDKFTGGLSDFVTKPKNLLTLAALGGAFTGKQKPPREKSPEELANEQKRYEKALRMTAEERAAREADKLSDRQMERRINRNQYLPEERYDIAPMYRKVHDPEEYKRTGKWFSYYNTPDFTGAPLHMKRGGSVPRMMFEEEVIEYPSMGGFLFRGDTNGQDDKIPAKLSDGEYVIPADVVAHAGDGNTDAGAKRFDALLKNIRKSKGGRVGLPPKIRPNLVHYMGK